VREPGQSGGWGIMKRDLRDFVRKYCGFSELRQMERRDGNWVEKEREEIC